MDPQYNAGFFVGAARDLSEGRNISIAYTYYSNVATDSTSTDAPLVLQSMVMNPSTADAANYWNSASAREYIGFQLGDVDYRQMLYCTPRASINYLAGLRYANLKQNFDSDFESNTSATVSSGVNFDGVGLRVGLEGEWHGCCGLFIYGKTAASFLGGTVEADYLQTSSTVDGPVADTTWKEARFVQMGEGEMGIGWASADGHFRGSIGYMVTGWLNIVKPADFIASVQANSYQEAHNPASSDMVFDGLVSRLEFSW